jgi:RNA polymerase sigma factor (sigma-70 family)
MTVEATARLSELAVVRTVGRPEVGASPTDADPISLVLAARDGSRAAWEELVDRFTPLLWVVARGHRLSSEDAADAVQMTWLRCVERLDQIRDPDSIAAWLTTICRRECLGIVRRHARARSEPIADDAAMTDPLATDAADALIKQEERNILREMISRLPQRQRRVLLALFDPNEGADSGYREIAQQLDLPVGSLGPTRQRALQRLRADPRLQSLRNT